MNTLKTTLALALLAATGVAQAEYSANIAVSSNYVWRGITQTDNQAAVSGGIDYSHEDGWYAGAWASNVDFSAGGSAGGTGYEMDLYGGYSGGTDEFGYDLGFIHYTYSATGAADFTELAASISSGVFSAGLNYTVASEVSDPSTFEEGDIYYWASASTELPHGFGLGGTIGYYTFEDDGDAAVGDADYGHIQIDVTKSDFTASVSYADSDTGDAIVNPNGDDPLFFVSWSKSFE